MIKIKMYDEVLEFTIKHNTLVVNDIGISYMPPVINYPDATTIVLQATGEVMVDEERRYISDIVLKAIVLTLLDMQKMK